MTLTNRLLLFFVGALAVVLVGFSIGVYMLARDHLYGRAADGLESAVRTLVAAAEVGPDGVEWEPAERAVGFTPGYGVVWRVSDEKGRIVAGSGGDDRLLGAAGAIEQPENRIDDHSQPWRVAGARLRPEKLRPEGLVHGRFAELTITAAVPLGPVRDTLNRLVGVLTGLSFAVLALALVTGRAVCRRALAPVARMAATARGMGAADFSERLPVGAVNDELTDLGRSFNGLLDRLHESFERQRRFTSEAAHQLRTPLAAVLGQAEVALRRERSGDEYRDALDTVRRQAGHLQQIVEALLFLARADADADSPAAERLDLCVWLSEHLRAWAEHSRAADLHFSASPNSAWVHAPPALLGELVNNLIDNALKYSVPGTPVTLRLEREPRMVRLVVEDRGCGVDPADLPHLFRPFFRSADVRRRGIAGVGLGLAVAARLAKAFGGDIDAISEVGKGSCFRVRLPSAPM
jgi:signal transduction histidine kinase